MKRIKKTVIMLIIIFALAIGGSGLNLLFSSNAFEQDQKIHVSSLFYPREGEGVSQGDEHAAQASKDILPQYLHEYENSGALLNIYNNTNKTSAIQTKKFSIADNTENDLLIRMRPTPEINRYQTMIKGKGEGGNDIPATVAYDDTSYWPMVRDITLTIRDAYHPDIFIEVYWSWRTAGNASYRFGNMTTRANNQKWGGERGDDNFREGKELGGALVPVSYWGYLDDIMEVYYDAAENKIYTIQCNASGVITGKKLLRDFNSTYNGKDVVWGGFQSGFVTMDIQFAGGTSDGYVVLVTDIDGLNLETDFEGYLLSENVQTYNSIVTSYEYELDETIFIDRTESYQLPAVTKTNFLHSIFITEQFFVTILDNKGKDITSTSVTGLNNGKWTDKAQFDPPGSGRYLLSYRKDEIILESLLCVVESCSVYDIFEDSENIQYKFNQSPPQFMNGQAGLGVEITQDAVLQFKNPINLSLLNESVPLVSYLVTPSKKSMLNQEELNAIIITITDINNPENFIKIKHKQSPLDINNSFVSVAANGQTYGGVKQNLAGNPFQSENTGYGTAIAPVFTGVKSTVTSLYYYSNKVFASKDFYSEKQVLVRDFNNPEHLLEGDSLFTGFNSNFVYLSIEFVGVKQKTGVILYDIAGQPFKDEFIIDNMEPEIIVDEAFFTPAIPMGEIGTKYYLPNADAIDMISGNLSDQVNIDVFYRYGEIDQTQIEIKDDYFVPLADGEYTLIYSVFDKALNYTQKILKVEVKNKLAYIDIIFDKEFPNTVLVGEIFELPTPTIINGSGNYTLNAIVTAPDGSTTSLGKKVLFDKQGFYSIAYEVTDWTKETKTFIKIIKAVYNQENSLIIEDISMPKALVKGKKLILPEAKAFDNISYLPETRLAPVKIYVSENNNEFVEVGADRVYTPTATEGRLIVEYRAVALLNTNITAVKTYEIILISPQKMGDFFYIEEDIIDIEYRIPSGGFIAEAHFSTNTNGAMMHFINKVPSNNFKITLSNPDLHKYTRLVLTLQDSVSASQRVSFILEAYKNNKSYLSFLGDNSLYLLEGNLLFNIDLTLKLFEGKSVYDGTNTFITDIKNYDSGEEFNGFESGLVYFTITFEGISTGGSAGVKINNLCNHPGIYEEINAFIPPMLITEYSINSYYNLGHTIILPKAYAIDLLDSDTSITVSITAPDGTIILENASANVNISLRLEMFGLYKVTYRAFNSSGVFITDTLNLTAYDDIAPVIEINGTVKTKYNIGQAFKMDNVFAKDNVTKQEDMVVRAFLLYKDGYYIFEISDGFVFKNSGEYILRYFVEDGGKNYTFRDFELKVQEV